MRRKVLIVDDNEVNRILLNSILQERYQVLQAVHGGEALEVIRREREGLSAILLDLVMPVMDGFALLEALGREFPKANIPVIVMTGEDTEAAEIRALHCGATDFLGKPYRPQIILARLENIIKLRETAALVHQVERDILTGLYNKEGFCVRLDQLLRDRPDLPVDLVVMDVGNFELVNALYGENTGDELLRSLARMLEESFGGQEAFFGRMSGDQYLLAFPGGGPSGDELWGRSRNWKNPLHLNLPLRFGICHVRGLAEPASVLCDNAKLAADSIRGRYDVRCAVYDDSIRAGLLQEQELAADLAQALEEGQVQPWYQPQCDPVTGRVVGVEALVRWNHPTRGFLSPDSFVPQFERNRLIVRLDDYMWEQSLQDLAQWLKVYPRAVPLALNVSRMDAYRLDLVDRLWGLVERAKVDPSMVRLEITESAYMDDPVRLSSTIESLRERGFPVEMDDFGSGWSSLNMLTELPLDGVKLDMKFMRGYRPGTRNSRFLRDLMTMLADLELPVTAEGVETEEQVAFLREMGCRSAQGLYYAPSLPIHQLGEFVMARI